jgi:hypothetical protein
MRARHEILDPLKVFQENYRKLSVDGVIQLKKSLSVCANDDQ